MNTIYCREGAINTVPSKRSWRGISFFNHTKFGFVMANDYKGNFYTNYCNGGTWTGWSKCNTGNEETLLEGSIDTIGAALILEKNYTNYDRIKIYADFYSNGKNSSCMFEGKVDEGAINLPSLNITYEESSKNTVVGEMVLYASANNKLTIQQNKAINLMTSDFTTNLITIRKITGVKN